MAMLNVSASLPTPMWAVVRFLASTRSPVGREQARSLLSPPTLLGENSKDSEETFDTAVRTLLDLGMISAESSNRLGLSSNIASLSETDLATYTDVLRQTIFDPTRNTGLGDGDDQTGPRDLVRALAWFLTRDPLAPPLGWDDVARLQDGALPAHVGNPIINDVRWGRFFYWAPALGFAAKPLFSGDGKGQKLVPDCTIAVKRVVLGHWQKGDRVDANEMMDRILEQLPVLPGGRFSRLLGLSAASHTASASCSFALLCGHDQGWISLDRRSDAPRDLLLADHDAVSSTRRVTDVTILGDPHG